MLGQAEEAQAQALQPLPAPAPEPRRPVALLPAPAEAQVRSRQRGWPTSRLPQSGQPRRHRVRPLGCRSGIPCRKTSTDCTMTLSRSRRSCIRAFLAAGNRVRPKVGTGSRNGDARASRESPLPLSCMFPEEATGSQAPCAGGAELEGKLGPVSALRSATPKPSSAHGGRRLEISGPEGPGNRVRPRLGASTPSALRRLQRFGASSALPPPPFGEPTPRHPGTRWPGDVAPCRRSPPAADGTAAACASGRRRAAVH